MADLPPLVERCYNRGPYKGGLKLMARTGQKSRILLNINKNPGQASAQPISPLCMNGYFSNFKSCFVKAKQSNPIQYISLMS